MPMYEDLFGQDAADDALPVSLRRRQVEPQTIGGDPYADNWAAQTTRSHVANLTNDLTNGVSFLGRGLVGDEEGRRRAGEAYLRKQEEARAMGPAIQSFDDAKAAGGGFGNYGAALAYQAAGLVPDIASTLTGIGAGATAARVGAKSLLRRSAAQELREFAARRGVYDAAEQAATRRAMLAAPDAKSIPNAVRVARAEARDGIEDTIARQAAIASGRTPRDVAAAARATKLGGRIGGTAASIPGLNGSMNAEKAASADTSTGDMWKLAAGTTAAAATQMIPLERFLGRFGQQAVQETTRKARRFLPQVGREAVLQGAAEGSQETVQQALQLASHAWVEENLGRLVDDDAIDQYIASFAAGSLLGGAMGAGGEASRGAARAAGGAGRKALAGVRWTRDKVKDVLGDYAQRARKARAVPGTPIDDPDAPVGKTGDALRRAHDAVRGVGQSVLGAGKRVTDRFRSFNDDIDFDQDLNDRIDRVYAAWEQGGAPLIIGERRASNQNPAALKDPLQAHLMAYVSADSPVWEFPEARDKVAKALSRLFTGKPSRDDRRTLEALVDSGSLQRQTLDSMAVVGAEWGERAKLVRRAPEPEPEGDEAPDGPMAAQLRGLGFQSSTDEDGWLQQQAEATDTSDAGAYDEDQQALDDYEAGRGIANRSAAGDIKNDALTERAGNADGTRTLPAERVANLEAAGRALAARRDAAPEAEREAIDAEYQQTLSDFKAAKAELRASLLGKNEKSGSGAVVVENQSGGGAAAWRKVAHEIDNTPNRVEIEPVNVGDKTELMRRRALSIDSLVTRYVNQIDDFDTSTPEGEQSRAKAALMQVFADLKSAGIKLRPSSITAGWLGDKGRAKNGTYIGRITPRDAAELRAMWAGGGDKKAAEKARAAVPMTKRQKKRAAKAPLGGAARQERLDKVYGTEREEARQGEHEIDSGNVDGRTSHRPMSRPPGAKSAQGDFVSTNSNIEDVSGSDRLGEIARKARQEAVSLGLADEDARIPGTVDERKQLLPKPLETRGRNPSARRARHNSVNDPRFDAGVEIGTQLLTAERDSGAISERRFNVQMTRLRNPESGLAAKYYNDAFNGKFVSAKVTEVKADKEKVDTKALRGEMHGVKDRYGSTPGFDPDERDDPKLSPVGAQDPSSARMPLAPKEVRDQLEEREKARVEKNRAIDKELATPSKGFGRAENLPARKKAAPPEITVTGVKGRRDEFADDIDDPGADMEARADQAGLGKGDHVARFALFDSIATDKALPANVRESARKAADAAVEAAAEAEIERARKAEAEVRREAMRAAAKAGVSYEQYIVQQRAAKLADVMAQAERFQQEQKALGAAKRRERMLNASRKGRSYDDLLRAERRAELESLLEAIGEADVRKMYGGDPVAMEELDLILNDVDFNDDLDTIGDATEGEHDTARESAMLNAILEAMGSKHRVTVRSDARINGARYTPGMATIRISPRLTGAERIEVLAHELGHHIVFAEIADAAGIAAGEVPSGSDNTSVRQRFELLQRHNPELYDALLADFNAWKEANPRSQQARVTRASRAPLHRAQSALGRSRHGSKPATELASDDARDLYLFDEWLADHIARALTTRKQGRSIIQKFFSSIANALRQAYRAMSGGDRKEWLPAKSVDDWVKSLFDRNKAAVRDTLKVDVPQKAADAAVRAATWQSILDKVNAGVDAATAAGRAKHLEDRPKSVFDRSNIADLLTFIKYTLPAEERSILERVFARGAANIRLREHWKEFPEFVALLDDGKQGMENRIALGYLAWREGGFTVGPEGKQAFKTVADDLAALAGVATDGELADRILGDIANGTVERFREKNKTYSVRELEARARGTAQRALNWVSTQGPISNGLAKFWQGTYSRMHDSGIPAMRAIGAALQRPHGATGDDDRGLIPATRTALYRQHRKVEDAFKALDPGERVRALSVLQRGAAAGSKAYDKKSPKVRAAVDAMRQVMRDAHAYLAGAGVDVPAKDFFFPVVMAIHDADAGAKLEALYSQPKFEASIRGIFNADQDEPIEPLVKKLVAAASQDANSWDPFDKKVEPGFRHLNKRLSQFVYDHGSAEDIRVFASLQTKNIDEVFARYFAPMVKFAEYKRREAEFKAALDDIEKQGGTKEDVALAKDAIRAALGTYGMDGSPTLAALSPALAQKFSGPKTKAFVQGTQSYENLRLLPMALLSSLVDPMGIAVRTGGGFKETWEGFKLGVRSLTNKKDARELLAMLDELGLADDFMPAIASHPVFDGQESGVSRRINEAVFKWNGMNAWVRATRVMAAHAGHRFLLKHGAADTDTSRRYLAELGLSPADIVANPDKPGQVVLNDKTRAALQQFADEAILRPNAMQVPLWHRDPYMGLITQYKAFAYAIYDQITGRIFRELNHGNFRVLLAAMSYLPIILMAELLRELIQHGSDGNPNRKDWGADDYALHAVSRSGLAGPQAEIAGNAIKDLEHNRLPTASLSGPALQQAGNVVKAVEGRRDRGKEFESALPGSALYRNWNDSGTAAEA